ncbi:MAG: autotransporter domain-containing protein [Erythrobacter sp.]|uniref:autotransporter domain-containing protein n=1 Tax=Erythrobacter sp. TaxID=1042 RepID=UPI00260CB006|nr:autotransporter domain-containing protein [Erythrobacter sp.]MDJ0979117.1 autotransporter domain-containing protein [Erythrobacter sp.]
MKMVRYLTSVGLVGLAGGLFSAPLSASGTQDDEVEPVSLQAQGTFQGFTIETRSATSVTPDLSQLPDFTNRRTLEAAPVSPTPEIIARDDVGLGGSVDVNDTQPSVVQLFIQDNLTGGVFFNCTGTVINPRTVLTAAHCLNDVSSESYGTPGSADSAVLVASGVDTSVRLFEYLGTGAGYNEGGVATSTDVVIHPSANIDDGGLPFPWADLAFVALDAPITDVPSMPILLTPLDELTHVIQVGYGSFGTAETGDVDIGFLRRVGENMLGAQASLADLNDAIFPDFAPTATNFGSTSQVYHFTDFDNPFRTPEEQAGCEFDGSGISCESFDAVRAIDWFDGDALPNEVGTAGGDSGSPLIADELGGPPVVTGVLSGGVSFFDIGNTYSDISFYNPLFPFFEFITENTPYKYVSAKRGSGNWSDPDHWTQDLDPGFLVDDGTGTLVNGIPEGEEEGVFATGPNVGTILGQDVAEFEEVNSIVLPPEGTPNFGSELPESSALLGPGSTGFVPNNTDGTPGVSFEAPAQYFDVILNRAGRTTVDMDVEIDRLTLDSRQATFRLPDEYTFTSIIGYEQYNGRAQIDGQFNAGLVALYGGTLEGTGTITSDAVFNLSAAISPAGDIFSGTLTIDGDYIQASEGALIVNARFVDRGRITTDLLQVTGDASLAGGLIVSARGRLRFGDEFTVLSANSILGEFDDTLLVTRSPLLFAESRVDGGNVLVEVQALRMGDLFQSDRNLRSIGEALDTLRFDGSYNDFAGLFNVIDNASVDSLIPTLSALTPTSAFSQSMIANSFSQRFTGQISQRTLSLRGGNRGAAGFSSAGGAMAGIAQTGGGEASPLGFFGTVSGQFLVSAEDRNSGVNALEESAFIQAGELTLGADMRMSEDLTIGFAVTNIRNGAALNGLRQRADDTSLSGAVYAAMHKGQAFTDVYFGFSRQNFGMERASQGDFSFAFDSVTGSADGSQTFGGVRLGYAFSILPGLEAGPVASVDYIRNDLGGYSEFGAGEFGLTVLDRSLTSVGSKAGMMASFDTTVARRWQLSAFGSAAYAHELADTEDVVTATLRDAPDVPFSIVNQLDPNWVSLTAGVDLALNRSFSVSLSGQSDLGRGVLTNNEARMSLNWRF